MKIRDYIKEIDWKDAENKKIGSKLLGDAIEYMRRVEDHIYKGNEIRNDMFMDLSEKQEEIDALDKKRTAAHNNMLASFESFLRLLTEQTEFDANKHNLSNRTRIADFVATIGFELIGKEPPSRAEGDVRDELAELIHRGETSYEQIEELAKTVLVDS